MYISPYNTDTIYNNYNFKFILFSVIYSIHIIEFISLFLQGYNRYFIISVNIFYVAVIALYLQEGLNLS
jgi:hypothetical protein